MTDETGQTDEIQDSLSTDYRVLATETAPPKLDESVMREARREACSNGPATGALGWLRPMTFVAVAGLSLALIVQMTDSNLLSPPIGAGLEDDGAPAESTSVFDDAARQTADRIRALEAESQPPTSMPPEAPAAVPRLERSDDNRISPDDRCSEDQTGDSGTWWQCIKDLEQRGLTDAAERELRALLEAYPRFTAPP